MPEPVEKTQAKIFLGFLLPAFIGGLSESMESNTVANRTIFAEGYRLLFDIPTEHMYQIIVQRPVKIFNKDIVWDWQWQMDEKGLYREMIVWRDMPFKYKASIIIGGQTFQDRDTTTINETISPYTTEELSAISENDEKNCGIENIYNRVDNVDLRRDQLAKGNLSLIKTKMVDQLNQDYTPIITKIFNVIGIQCFPEFYSKTISTKMFNQYNLIKKMDSFYLKPPSLDTLWKKYLKFVLDELFEAESMK